jgi:hypothetical protein
MPKMQMICRNCGSINVVADAYAGWNVETQAWEISNVFDKGAHCDECEGETRIDEVEWDADCDEAENYHKE